jgi:hypothetical protein
MTYRSALIAVVALILLPLAAQAQLATPAQPQAAAPAPPAVPPKPQFTTIATYPGSGGQVVVGTFLDNDQRVGLIGVASVRRASVAFAKDEWASLLDLWQQARAVRSATWQTVGTFKETGTKEPAQLTVMGGPGVQFAVANPRGTFTVSVPKGDYAKLDASLHKVALFLDGAAAEPDKPAPTRHRLHRKKPQVAAEPAAAPARRCTGIWC